MFVQQTELKRLILNVSPVQVWAFASGYMKKTICFGRFWVVWVVFLFSLQPALWALELDLSQFPLTDQHDQTLKAPQQVHYLLFAGDQASFELVSDELNQKGQDWLDQRQTIILADIHKMPPLISKLFALPAMKKFSFQLFLDHQGDYTQTWPHPPKLLVLFDLRSPTLVSRQIGSFTELEEALKP